MATTEKGGVASVKKSKSLYAVAIYGFIVLFIITVFPYLPFGKDGSLFESGLKRFNNGEYGNLIATISMLIHSVILLVVAIVFINKLKKYRAGVGYSFYKLFAITIDLAMATLVIFHFTGNMEALNYSYGIEYWLIVLALYAVGLIFALIAQLCNYDLRASKGKVLYHLLSWAWKIGVIFLLVYRMNTVETRYIQESWYDGFQMTVIYNESRQSAVRGVYNVALVIYSLIAVLATVKICMPLNNAFSYMTTRRRRHSKYSPLPVWQHVIYTLAVIVLLVVMLVNNGTEEVWTIILLLLLGIVDIVGAKLYNKFVSKKMYVEEVPAFAGFFRKKNDEKKTDESAAVESMGIKTKDDIKEWDVNELAVRNENLDFKDKTSIDKMCADLCLAVSDHGILTDKSEMQKVLAAVLSSKVTFIKTGADSDTLRDFAETISTFFGEDLFYERRENPNEEYISVVNELAATIESAVSVQTEEPQTGRSIADILAGNSGEGETSQTEVSEEHTGNSIADLLAMATEPVVNAAQEENGALDVETNAEVKPAAPVVKPKPARRAKTDAEKQRELKYGVVGGMFVANYLSNTFGVVFVDNTAMDAVGDFDADVISAIAGNEESVFVGKVRGLPETDDYKRGSVKISDNLRLVVFINEEMAAALEPDWIKYSSIVDLPLASNGEGENALFIKSGTSFGMIKESLEEAQETCYLTEDYWRKIDRLEEYLTEHTGIEFDNRFIRQMEENIAAFMACGMNKAEALDAILCEKLIPLVATERDKILAAHEQDFTFKLDELFGFENIPLTKQAISEYGLKK